MSFSHTSDLIKVEIIKNMIDTKYNGGEKMSSLDKLLKRFLELDHDIRFEEIVKGMKEYRNEIKQPKGGSSHYSFVKPGCSRIVWKFLKIKMKGDMYYLIQIFLDV